MPGKYSQEAVAALLRRRKSSVFSEPLITDADSEDETAGLTVPFQIDLENSPFWPPPSVSAITGWCVWEMEKIFERRLRPTESHSYLTSSTRTGATSGPKVPSSGMRICLSNKAKSPESVMSPSDRDSDAQSFSTAAIRRDRSTPEMRSAFQKERT